MDINATIIATLKDKIEKLEDILSESSDFLDLNNYNVVTGQIEAYKDCINILEEVNIE